MDFNALIRKLSAVRHDLPLIATVTLDVAGARHLPAASRVFLKDHVLDRLASEAQPPALRATLKKISRQIQAFVADALDPETRGVFIAAGPGLFEPVELSASLRNFVHVGRSPYLAPLLEAIARVPVSLVVEADLRGIRIDEMDLSGRRPLGRIEGRIVERDVQRASSGRAVQAGGSRRAGKSGVGGSIRDRFQQGLDAATGRSVREAVRTLESRMKRIPAAAILFFGSNELASLFEEQLPPHRRGAFHHAGPAAARDGSTTDAVLRTLAVLHEERLRGEVLDYLSRRRQGHQVSWGPRDVMEDLSQGRVRRIYVDADDPVPGMACRTCGTHFPGEGRACDYCAGEVMPVSLTQEVVNRAIHHPPLDLTFVPKPAPWLTQVGGMTALTSERGART